MDEFYEPPKLTPVDRSTLERYATCPAQARFIDSGQFKTSGTMAAVGDQVHQAIAEALQVYVEENGMLSPKDLADEVARNLYDSRPDVQPEAVNSFRFSIWKWAKYIGNIHFYNIMKFDGGEGERSGQLAWDLIDLGVRPTSEVDLLYSTPSSEVLEELDWKSGWKYWTEKDIAHSFQFQMHAWLVFQNYPEVNCLRVYIWNTKRAKRSWSCEFTRSNLSQIDSRIKMAIQSWDQHKDKKPEQAPTWPTRDKCSICDAAALCPVTDRDVKEVIEDPGKFLDETIAYEEKLNARKKLLWDQVQKQGHDIVSESGAAFGFNKPKSERKPSNPFYQAEGD